MALRVDILLALGALARRMFRPELPEDVESISYADAYFERERELSRQFLLRFPPSGRVLEIGCGFGGLLAELHAAGCEAIGIDVSEHRVGYASTAKGLDARVADAQQLPFEDGSFDLVMSTAVLEHIPDILSCLRESHRVLSPGGRFVARWGPGWRTYNGPHLIKALGVPWVHALFSDRTIVQALEQQRRAGRWPETYLDDKIQDFQTMGRLTRHKLRSAARAAGFEIIVEASHSPRPLKQQLARLPLLDEVLAGELTVDLLRRG